eukprot:19708-Heterococcus_DN1.PRE.2
MHQRKVDTSCAVRTNVKHNRALLLLNKHLCTTSVTDVQLAPLSVAMYYQQCYAGINTCYLCVHMCNLPDHKQQPTI